MKLFQSIRVGVFLGWRQIRRAGVWSTALIILIMILTFMNLVFVNGVLVGLVEGAGIAYRTQYSGDVLISRLPSKYYIMRTPDILRTLDGMDEVQSYSPRYLAGGSAEANYKNKSNLSDRPDEVSASVAGINPEKEDKTTHLSDRIIAGEYLKSGDENGILIGHRLLDQYANVPGISTESLTGIEIGSKVRVRVNGSVREMTVRGIVKSKMQEVSRRIYMVDTLMRKLMARTDNNVDEIAITLIPGANPDLIKKDLIRSSVDKNATVETWEESQGDFFKDITLTFKLLGSMVGGIGLIVAAITVFIIIFINAITRKKYIGIMKGIGISGLAIEISYVMQSVLYALVGSGVGMVIVCAFMKPYFMEHPIDFPFSDGILYAPISEVLIKVLLMVVATIIAGYVPSRMIIKKNTLDAILGR